MSGGKCQGTTQFVFYESMSDSNYRWRVVVPIMEAGVTRIATNYPLTPAKRLSLSLIRESCLPSSQLKSAFEHPLRPGADVARYWAGRRAEVSCKERTRKRARTVHREPGSEET